MKEISKRFQNETYYGTCRTQFFFTYIKYLDSNEPNYLFDKYNMLENCTKDTKILETYKDGSILYQVTIKFNKSGYHYASIKYEEGICTSGYNRFFVISNFNFLHCCIGNGN